MATVTTTVANGLVVKTNPYPHVANFVGDLAGAGIPIVEHTVLWPRQTLTILAVKSVSVWRMECEAIVFGPCPSLARGSVMATRHMLSIEVREDMSETWIRLFKNPNQNQLLLNHLSFPTSTPVMTCAI